MRCQSELRSGELHHPHPERAVLLIRAPRKQPPCRDRAPSKRSKCVSAREAKRGAPPANPSLGGASLPWTAGAAAQVPGGLLCFPPPQPCMQTPGELGRTGHCLREEFVKCGAQTLEAGFSTLSEARWVPGLHPRETMHIPGSLNLECSQGMT